MTGIVHVTHPAVVRYVPKGGTNERLAFRLLSTPVRLREVDPAAFEHAANLSSAGRNPLRLYYAFEGRLWYKLLHHTATPGGDDNPPVGIDEFVAYLQGRHASLDHLSDVDQHFARTPLCALEPDKDQTRGRDFDMGQARHVAWDGTERARASLARFMEQEVALVGDGVFVRAAGPLAQMDRRADRFYTQEFARYFYGSQFGARFDRLAEMWDFERTAGRALPERMPNQNRNRAFDLRLQTTVERFPSHLVGDADLGIFVNYIPEEALKGAARVLRVAAEDPGLGVRLQSGAERLRHWEALGFTSSIEPEEWEECLCDVRAFLEAAFESSPRLRREPVLARAALYVDAIALPRLRQAAGVAPEDDEALTGIGPRP